MDETNQVTTAGIALTQLSLLSEALLWTAFVMRAPENLVTSLAGLRQTLGSTGPMLREKLEGSLASRDLRSCEQLLDDLIGQLRTDPLPWADVQATAYRLLSMTRGLGDVARPGPQDRLEK